MPDIFDKEKNTELRGRLAKLTSESPALWGKMNVSQMVLHCQKPLDVAVGNLNLKPGFISFLFGKMAKNDFLKKREFKRSLPTHPTFRIVDMPEFEKEKKVLEDLIFLFGEKGPDVIANKKHPFFGVMTDEEWGVLQYIHLDHHLKQFGV